MSKYISLYEVSKDLEDIDELLEQAETEQEAVIVQGIRDAIEQTFLYRVDDAANYIARNNSYIDAIKAQEERLKELRTAVEKKASRFENYVLEIMLKHNIKKKDTPVGVLKVTTGEKTLYNGTKDDLEDRFIRTKVTKDIDKTAIKKALKSGETIAGAELVKTYNFKFK